MILTREGASKVNILQKIQSKDLLEQWVDELNKFLVIDEEPPIYQTKSGREKRRKSVIGILHGSKNTLTGIVDVAMIGSMYSKGKFNLSGSNSPQLCCVTNFFK